MSHDWEEEAGFQPSLASVGNELGVVIEAGPIDLADELANLNI